jgi:DNA helicase-2/ATP-dependent DNA helicase PcrA
VRELIRKYENNEWHEKLKKELNPDQYFFVTHENSAILGIAGPGSGKTRALTYRVANLLYENVPPERILLVTFTNKAAEEMKNRVREILGYLPKGLWAGTFHSIGARMLRRHARLVGREANFSILDEDDRERMLKSILSTLIPTFTARDKKFLKKGTAGKILSLSRNADIHQDEYIKENNPELEDYIPVFQQLNTLYEKRKELANAFDFDDLLVRWLGLLEENEHLKKYYQEHFSYILVDEYQDTNTIQDRLILLLGEKSSICLVGDDAQSIYSFRSAEIGNILNFPDHKPSCTVVKLVHNYRSIPEILELANASITRNKNQFPKELYTTRPSGEKPQVFLARDNLEEAHFVADKILELYDKGEDLGQMAVLYRSSYLSQELEMALLNRAIPYLTFGGLKFLQRAHIKDIIAWLKIIENPRDELSWQRVSLMQSGIGEATFRDVWALLRAFPDPLEAAIQGKAFPKRGKKGWKILVDTFRLLITEGKENVSRLIQIIMESPYQEYLAEKYPEDYVERNLGIERMAAYGSRFATLQDFLESLLLEEALFLENVKEENPEKDYLTLSTIHSAKGKEWKTVFLIGLNEGRFPSPLGMENIDEERRLFYVAVTRAKDRLFLTCAEDDFRGWGNYTGGPSIFLKELPLDSYECPEPIGDRGYY